MGSLSLNDYEDVRIWAPWGHMAGRWYGNRSERPILALHGWLDNLGTFDTLIPLLPDYLGILCIDLPGHGCSSRLPPGMHYSADDWILVIGRIMKAYKWSKVSLMGHSLGGVLSFIYTSLAPQTVDLVITLDIIISPFDSAESLSVMANYMEKHLIEEERAQQNTIHEPPSYTMEQLRSVLSKGTFNSVPLEFAQHLLNRSVNKSQLYPDKFYFSRDGRTKYHSLFPLNAPQAAEMALRIKDKPFLILKGSDSPFINGNSDEVISILANQNPHFEYHEVSGLHHVHLVNAKECAQHIIPFLRRHRPASLASWSLAGEEDSLSREERLKTQEGFFSRNLKQRNKL